MPNNMPNLIKKQQLFLDSKNKILSQWKEYDFFNLLFKNRTFEDDAYVDNFVENYLDGVFDYFMDAIARDISIGECPAMHSLLLHLKDRDIGVSELFSMCNHLRKIIINFTYESKIDSQELFNEITYLFDENFKSILHFYTDTVFQKEQEISRSVKLLSEYKKALDDSALISKTDINGVITYVNDKLVKLCGFSRDELVGKKHNVMKHNDMSNDYYQNLWRELKQNNIFKGTIKNRKKNGKAFYIDVTIVKINDPYDDSSEYMSVAYDITTLVKSRIEALEASKAKEYFLSNMSHEIRTPLNAILGFVNLLMDEDLSKKHRKYLDIIFNSGENLLSIINDILDFSKLRSGEFSIDPKVFSIHDEISHTMELFVASANSKNITLTSFIDPTIPTEIFADPLRIQQILSNFLSNAIKFTPYGGVISVEASCENSILKIRVKDNGIGISKEDLKDVFSAFAQAQHSEKKKNDGTGLGLYICEQLASHMNGRVTANSSLGKGSTFWLKIPVQIRSTSCKVIEEIDEFKSLSVVVYSKDEDSFQKYESFIKYSDIFGMKTTIVDNLDMDFDIAIVIYEDIDETLKRKIIKSNKKYIILMNKIRDDFENYLHITPLYFPLYCSKIRTALLELLHPESYVQPVKKISKKFHGHILIAEDNEANQELIKILLGKYGVTFDMAVNGLEAVNLYKLHKYDLILMDEQMPVMDGNEAVKEIVRYEKENHFTHTPVSALTANVIQVIKNKNITYGYDAFLAKPIVLKDLEKVFQMYLKTAYVDVESSKEKELISNKIEGLDIQSLTEELMLSEDEIIMLLTLFMKKMKKLLPELHEVIQSKDYKKIGLIAHSIKGSSGNFRMEILQNISSEIEQMAKNENSDYDYSGNCKKIEERISEIKIP